MKKLFLLTFLCGLGLTAIAGCSDGAKPEASATPEPTLAEINAGVETFAESAAPAPKKDNVVDLKNDTQYRPGKKVKQLTILDFNATWCGPCKQFAPVFHDASKKYGGKVDFISVDVDVNPKTAQAFGIQAVPTVIFLKPDGTKKVYVGTDDLMPLEKFEALIKAAL